MPLTRPLDRCVIVITGASRGIGAATAIELARRGATLVLAARGEKPLRDTARRCAALGGRALAVPTDVADPDAVEALAAAAVDAYGRIDAWVNNAAVALWAGLPDAALDEVRRVIETNLYGTLYGMRAALPRLRAAGGGVIVNNVSILGIVSMPHMGAYNISKHAMVGLSDTFRQDLRVAGDHAVSVCTVLPATIDTPLYDFAGNRTGHRLRPPPPLYPPRVVARTIVRVLRRPRRQVYSGGAGRLLAAQWRLLPSLTERALTRYGHHTMLTRQPAASTSGNLFVPTPGPAEVDGGRRGRLRHTARRVAGAAAVAAVGAAVARRVFND